MYQAERAVEAADRIYKLYETRNPDKLARYLNITVLPRPFKTQKGAYKVIERNSFIFIKNDLHPVMRSIVMLHEIGHHVQHRDQAIALGGFQEFVIFDMRDNIMEYEANMFTAQLSMDDDDVLDLIYKGFGVGQIARAMNSDINLVALKVAALNKSGYQFREQEHNNKFLK